MDKSYFKIVAVYTTNNKTIRNYMNYRHKSSVNSEGVQ